jgi:hypothetical protein
MAVTHTSFVMGQNMLRSEFRGAFGGMLLVPVGSQVSPQGCKAGAPQKTPLGKKKSCCTSKKEVPAKARSVNLTAAVRNVAS